MLIHSLSYLTWVGPAAYAEDFVRAHQWICGHYRTGLSVLHGLPVLQDGTDDLNIANALSTVFRWYSLAANPAERDIIRTRSVWNDILLATAVQSSTAASYSPKGGSGQPSAPLTASSSKPSALPSLPPSTASPLVIVRGELPSASLLPKDPSSMSSTLLNCPPMVQGSPILKLRLPTLLDSLKPTIFHTAWIRGLSLRGQEGQERRRSASQEGQGLV